MLREMRDIFHASGSIIASFQSSLRADGLADSRPVEKKRLWKGTNALSGKASMSIHEELTIRLEDWS